MRKRKEKFFCGKCKHLNITEEEQNKQKIKLPHMCLFYNKKIYHLRYHPELMRLNTCLKENNKSIKDEK